MYIIMGCVQQLQKEGKFISLRMIKPVNYDILKTKVT